MTQLPLITLYVQIKVSWFKHSVVLKRLRYGIARLFISFVSRRSIIYFSEWSQTPTYSHVAVVAGLFDQRPGAIRNDRVFSKPKPPPYFHLPQICMAQACNFHQRPGQT